SRLKSVSRLWPEASDRPLHVWLEPSILGLKRFLGGHRPCPVFNTGPYAAPHPAGLAAAWPSGRRETRGVASRAARPEPGRHSSTFRPCWRQVATTVRMFSTKRLPVSLSVP